MIDRPVGPFSSTFVYVVRTDGIAFETDYTQFITGKNHLRGAKFGVPWAVVWESPSTAPQIPALLEAIKVIESYGATVYKYVPLFFLAWLGSCEA